MTTFHGPGQLVGYLIIKLEAKDLHEYLRMLLETVAEVPCSYGLNPEFKSGYRSVVRWGQRSQVSGDRRGGG